MMSNKTNIEEDIKMLRSLNVGDDIEFKQAIENILADRERLEKQLKIKNSDIEYLQRKINKHFISDTEYIDIQAKANKYDSLVEKIKDNLREKEIIKECETISDREHLDGEIFALQELLDTEKEN